MKLSLLIIIWFSLIIIVVNYWMSPAFNNFNCYFTKGCYIHILLKIRLLYLKKIKYLKYSQKSYY